MARAIGIILAIAVVLGCGSQSLQPAKREVAASPEMAASPEAAAPPESAKKPPVLVPVTGDATVSMTAWFQVGSQDDPVGKEGLAWMTGQLIAEGATQSRSYQEILAALFPMAATYRVRVDREMTTLSGRAHRDHIERYLTLFGEAYTRPAFAAEDIERIRSRGLTYLEKTLRYASDEELGKAALYDFVFAGTRYAHPAIGTVAGLKSITAADIEAFYRRHYTKSRTVVGLGGGYDDALVRALSATTDALPPEDSTAPKPAAPRPEEIQGRHVLVVDKPGADASISFGFPINVHRGEKDFYALSIAISWLGEHRSSTSHLYQVIREARGLNYGDYAYIEAFPEGGRLQMPPANVARKQQIFEVWIRTLPNDKAVFALRAALRELRQLTERGMSREEFELTRSFLRKYVLHHAPTTMMRLGQAIDDRFYSLETPHLQMHLRMMEELTLDDVNRAIKKHLQYQNLKIAIVSGQAQMLRQALATGAPSTITYPTSKPASVLAVDKEIAVEKLDISPENIRVIPVEQILAGQPAL